MRVTIEHRETTGIIGSRKDCYVDCKVDFSEEERAIIKVRDLYRESFTVRASTPIPSGHSYLATAAMRLIGRFMIPVGIVYAIYEDMAHAKSNYDAPLFFGGIALEIYGFIRAYREDNRIYDDKQTITVKQLLANPAFTVHAWNAGYAQGIESTIREHLIALKSLIQSNATLQTKQTFEL